MSDEDELVAVSPIHSVRLAAEYSPWIRQPPRQDFVVRTIQRKEANGLPLMSADIVIAGEATRATFGLADRYPLHFRKTYFPARLHGDPCDEFQRQREASEILGLPPPIGHTATVFRTCLLPGVPYSRLSPLHSEPDESNIARAHSMPLAEAAGLWRFAQGAFDALMRLHEGGLAHGDAELHNFVVCAAPLDILPIDFEAAVRRDRLSDAQWQSRCEADLREWLREAVFLECRLGQQPGVLAERARASLESLFRDPDRFRREIGEQTSPRA